MRDFHEILQEVCSFLDEIGFGFLHEGVDFLYSTGKSVENGWEADKSKVTVNSHDVSLRAYPIWTTEFILLHELGHRYLEVFLRKEFIKEVVHPVFGNVNGKYRVFLRKKRTSPDHLSPYSTVHPADDFCEVFALCLWSKRRGKNPLWFVRARSKSERLAEKIRLVSDLIGLGESGGMADTRDSKSRDHKS